MKSQICGGPLVCKKFKPALQCKVLITITIHKYHAELIVWPKKEQFEQQHAYAKDWIIKLVLGTVYSQNKPM